MSRTLNARKQYIRNPEAWIGRRVRHMANWRSFIEADEYFVCEWSGKLCRREDEHHIGNLAEARELLARGWNVCYSYSEAATIEMLKQVKPDYSVRWLGTGFEEIYTQAA
jgi:hypothetical protein